MKKGIEHLPISRYGWIVLTSDVAFLRSSCLFKKQTRTNLNDPWTSTTLRFRPFVDSKKFSVEILLRFDFGSHSL